MLTVRSREAGFFVCVEHNLYRFMKIVWHKHNLMISSSVGSGHPDKQSYKIPHEHLLGWGNFSEKIISIKLNH